MRLRRRETSSLKSVFVCHKCFFFLGLYWVIFLRLVNGGIVALLQTKGVICRSFWRFKQARRETRPLTVLHHPHKSPLFVWWVKHVFLRFHYHSVLERINKHSRRMFATPSEHERESEISTAQRHQSMRLTCVNDERRSWKKLSEILTAFSKVDSSAKIKQNRVTAIDSFNIRATDPNSRMASLVSKTVHLCIWH